MKINFTLVSCTLVAASFIGLLLTLDAPPAPENNRKSLGGPMAIGGEEGMSERLKYELNRLRDPETGLIPYGIRYRELEFAASMPSDAMVPGRMMSQAVWNARGPWNVGGRTRAFGIDIMDTNTFIAGGTSSGMWRSTDGGATWARTFNNIQYESITCLVQDKRPGKTNTWYAGAGEAYGASASAPGAYYLGNGMWKSTDNGQTWTILSATSIGNSQSFTSPWHVTWNVAIDPSDTVNDEVYAANYGYIYRSTNGGTTWAGVKGSFNSSSAYFTDVAVTDSGIVYATFSSDGGVNKGIWRSTDGLTWTDITPTNFPTAYNRIVIGISPSDQNQVWFLGNTPGFGQPDTNFVGDVEWNSLWKYTYISGNGSGTGGSWSDRSSSLPTTGGPFDKFNCQGSYDLVVSVHPNDTNTVFIGGTNLYRSTNGFADATQTTFIGGYEQGATLPIVNSYNNHHPDQHGLAFMPGNPSTLICYNDGGMFKTNDCMASTVNWTSLNDGYVTSLFYTIALDHGTPNNDVIVAGAQDNGSWFTNNANLQSPWVTPRGGDGSYCQIEDGRTNYYLSIQNGKMMKATLDANGTVQTFARIDPIGGTGYQFINPYILDPNNNNIMYLAGGKKLWRNSDLSQIPMIGNWDSITTNWTAWTDTVPMSGARISAVTVSKTPANRVYYGTTFRKIYRVDNANTGTPTPIDITSTATQVVMPGGNVSCMATNPNNADELMVCYSNYNVQSVFYSPTGGLPTTNWSRVGGNLENPGGPSVRWGVIMPVSDGKIYMVATSSGIYATDTLMGSNTVWVKQGANTIGNAICDMIDYRMSDGRVVVATHGHGIFSTTITSVNDIVTIRDIESTKADFKLTNYPNPFSSSTTIEFMLEKRSEVKLVVLDLFGRQVAQLLNERMDSGTHKVEFGKGRLSSGTYYVSLQVGELRESRKMLLIE